MALGAKFCSCFNGNEEELLWSCQNKPGMAREAWSQGSNAVRACPGGDGVAGAPDTVVSVGRQALIGLIWLLFPKALNFAQDALGLPAGALLWWGISTMAGLTSPHPNWILLSNGQWLVMNDWQVGSADGKGWGWYTYTAILPDYNVFCSGQRIKLVKHLF